MKSNRKLQKMFKTNYNLKKITSPANEFLLYTVKAIGKFNISKKNHFEKNYKSSYNEFFLHRETHCFL